MPPDGRHARLRRTRHVQTTERVDAYKELAEVQHVAGRFIEEAGELRMSQIPIVRRLAVQFGKGVMVELDHPVVPHTMDLFRKGTQRSFVSGYFGWMSHVRVTLPVRFIVELLPEVVWRPGVKILFILRVRRTEVAYVRDLRVAGPLCGLVASMAVVFECNVHGTPPYVYLW